MGTFVGGRQITGLFEIAQAEAARQAAAGKSVVSSIGKAKPVVASVGRSGARLTQAEMDLIRNSEAICTSAASARARGSVAATSLEAQCAAFRARTAELTQGGRGGDEEESPGVPRAVLIAGGAVAVLGVAAVVFKLTR